MKYPITRPVVQLHRPAATLRVRPRTQGNYIQECNRVYAEAHGMGLVMDIFRPEGDGNGLGVVDIISSGWYSDRVQLNEHIGLGVYDVLCAHGYTVFALSPGSITKCTGLDMVQHIHAGIRYIKAMADEWGIRPDALGLTGASAGGHLAALTALTPKPRRKTSRDPFHRHDSTVAAVGLFFPPTDLIDYDGRLFAFATAEGTHLAHLLFEEGVDGHSEAELRTRMEALSPARQVTDTPPPFLLFHGDADPIVPLAQSRKLAAALSAAGGMVELVVKKGGGHPWKDTRPELEQLADCFYTQLTRL